MKNTLENKAAFMAQYWGQEILFYALNEKVYPVNANIGDTDTDIDRYTALLTPIKSISDEDAIEVAGICGFKFKTVYRDGYCVYISRSKSGSSKTYNYERVVIRFDGWIEYDDKVPYEGSYGSVPVAVFDYLRSKGYALPWRGLSVEKQIEYGWVKLKN